MPNCEGNPTLDTVDKLANALGFRLGLALLVATPAATKPRTRKADGIHTTRNAGKTKPPLKSPRARHN